MKYRMTAKAIEDYIAEVERLPATSDDPVADTIEKRIMAATAPNAGSVYRLNASFMGPDVLEDITKLAILIKTYNDKIGGNAEGDAASAAAALATIRELSARIYDIVGDATAETGLEWRYGYVQENGIVTVLESPTRAIVTTAIARADDIRMIEYTGESYNGDKPYFVHLAQYRAGTPGVSTFIGRTTLEYAPTGIHNVVTLDDNCAQYMYVIGYLASSGDTATYDDANNFEATIYTDKAEAIREDLAELSTKIYGRLTPVNDIQFVIGNIYAEYYSTGGIVFPAGRISYSSTFYVIPAVPVNVKNHKYIHYTAPVTGGNRHYPYGIVFYSDGLYDGETMADAPEDYFISGLCNSCTPSSGYEWRTIQIPEGAAWVMFNYWIQPDLNNSIPFKFYFADEYENSSDYAARHSFSGSSDDWLIEEARRLGLHTVPDNETQLNIVRRCRQMTDIEWTPAVDLPRFNLITRSPGFNGPGKSVNVRNKFSAGVKYKGIPYTKCKETLKDPYVYEHEKYMLDNFYVGFGIGPETFITAVQNKNSLLCQRGTELLEHERDNPDDKTALAAHVGTVYGLVCSALASYSLGLSTLYTAAQIGNIEGISRQTPEGAGRTGTLSDWWDGEHLEDKLKLGDILNYSGYHSIVVTDIVKDAAGEIVCVELSEATTHGNGNEDVFGGPDGGICRRKGFTPKDLIDRFGAYYVVLRYTATVSYAMDANSRLQGEPEGFRLTELPIMPYEGSRFAYKKAWLAANPIRFIISTEGYNRVLIYKTTDSTTPVQSIAIDPTDTSVEVDASSYAVGDYAVCLALYDGATEDHRTAVGWFSIIN